MGNYCCADDNKQAPRITFSGIDIKNKQKIDWQIDEISIYQAIYNSHLPMITKWVREPKELNSDSCEQLAAARWFRMFSTNLNEVCLKNGTNFHNSSKETNFLYFLSKKDQEFWSTWKKNLDTFW